MRTAYPSSTSPHCERRRPTPHPYVARSWRDRGEIVARLWRDCGEIVARSAQSARAVRRVPPQLDQCHARR
eukprot:417555-Prymnesium_polylepis.1